ncbi:MAG: flagellar biosynthetic protein FliR [bacterium]
MNVEPLLNSLLLWVLIFIRIISALVVMPLFGHEGFPLIAKIGLAACLALLLLPNVSPPTGWAGIGSGLLAFTALILPEIAMGVLIGMLAHFLFYGVKLAGEYIGMQMGFGIVQIIDPQTQQQSSIIGHFQYLFAVLIFLVFNGHHFLLSGLQQTFSAVPLGGVQFSSGLVDMFVVGMGKIFVAAVKIGAPVMAALFLADVVLGFVARTVPQMNVFIVGFPLKIGLGLFALALSLPMFVYVLELLWKNFQGDWLRFIALFNP